MNVPQDLGYTKEHEWLRVADGVATVGITAFATDSLGDIVYLQLPSVGDTVTAGEVCGEIESTKSVSELYAPAGGEIVEVNDAAVDSPEIVNTDPYGDGWLFRVRTAEVPELLDAAAYVALTDGEV
ncbi:glycine cleavage system H protein [Amycolatopsis arida]|uniref:Glycine cleavage system H protein n=1 Tax=Amycolatopsis arida TaxID=587909 RepID=A0A1I5KYU0_9PSEU|nr:glycine cleavage system protein GcvH [Amycolatopsis arida]TDX85882.1 glycine cleavage system H protein [Amycolatopsis arida]SFO90068.1 glycine cleavage system H protein [Amycolatopsis arida]